MHRGIAGIGFFLCCKNQGWIDAADPLIMRPPMPKRNPQQSTRRRKEASAACSRGPGAGSLLLFWPFHLFNLLTRPLAQPVNCLPGILSRGGMQKTSRLRVTGSAGSATFTGPYEKNDLDRLRRYGRCVADGVDSTRICLRAA